MPSGWWGDRTWWLFTGWPGASMYMLELTALDLRMARDSLVDVFLERIRDRLRQRHRSPLRPGRRERRFVQLRSHSPHGALPFDAVGRFPDPAAGVDGIMQPLRRS